MDALGIQSVLFDEFWGVWDSPEPTHIKPGYVLTNGAWRTAFPTAEEASLNFPDRFAYLVRIDRRDPEIEAVMRSIASSPHAKAFRLQPCWTLDEVEAFRSGAYDQIVEIAIDVGMPLCWFAAGYAAEVGDYARRYPNSTMVLDHCGMGFPNIPPNRIPEYEQSVLDPAYFSEVTKIADYPNVILKWSHVQDRFGVTAYPYEGLRPYLRQAIQAFGSDRLMWASDKTVMFGHTWGDLLYGLRDDPEFSFEEKYDLLGKTARRVLNWEITNSSG